MKHIEKEIDRTIRDARAKEKRQRRKETSEDRPERKPFLDGVKSPLRRYERPKS